jgi:hypothetical protein
MRTKSPRCLHQCTEVLLDVATSSRTSLGPTETAAIALASESESLASPNFDALHTRDAGSAEEMIANYHAKE